MTCYMGGLHCTNQVIKCRVGCPVGDARERSAGTGSLFGTGQVTSTSGAMEGAPAPMSTIDDGCDLRRPLKLTSDAVRARRLQRSQPRMQPQEQIDCHPVQPVLYSANTVPAGAPTAPVYSHTAVSELKAELERLSQRPNEEMFTMQSKRKREEHADDSPDKITKRFEGKGTQPREEESKLVVMEARVKSMMRELQDVEEYKKRQERKVQVLKMERQTAEDGREQAEQRVKETERRLLSITLSLQSMEESKQNEVLKGKSVLSKLEAVKRQLQKEKDGRVCDQELITALELEVEEHMETIAELEKTVNEQGTATALHLSTLKETQKMIDEVSNARDALRAEVEDLKARCASAEFILEEQHLTHEGRSSCATSPSLSPYSTITEADASASLENDRWNKTKLPEWRRS